MSKNILIQHIGTKSQSIIFMERVYSYQNVQGMIVYKQQSLRSFSNLALLQKKSFSLCSTETSWTVILLLASLTNW